MRGKNLKPNDKSKNLLDNFDLWEELEDQTGEKISGGGIFRFENRTTENIDILVDSLDFLTFPQQNFTISPFNLFGQEAISVPGNNISVQFDTITGTIPIQPNNLDIQDMAFNQVGTFTSNGVIDLNIE